MFIAILIMAVMLLLKLFIKTDEATLEMSLFIGLALPRI
jgi:hypothetical protein